jgi:hypothetical protein
VIPPWSTWGSGELLKMHNRPAEKSMAGRLPRPTVGTLALLPVHGSEEFRRSQKWERNTCHFGGPADSGSPVALRPPLAGGMPFRLLYMTTMAGFLAYVNETGIELSPSESFQPGCRRPVTQLSGGIVGPVRSPRPTPIAVASREFGCNDEFVGIPEPL